MDISKSISNIRERKGIKQADIAKVLEIEQSNYSRLEKRGDKMTIGQLKGIADALGVSITEVLSSSGSTQTNEKSELVEKLNQQLEQLKKDRDEYKIKVDAYEDMFKLLGLSLKELVKNAYNKTVLNDIREPPLTTIPLEMSKTTEEGTKD